MLGQILIYTAFVVSILSSVFYFISRKNESTTKIGRWLYYGLTGLVLAISMYLLSNILSHNFQMTYVWEYSSKTLPLNLLISTFYAGQQGSFLLWVLMLTLIGFFLIPYVKERNYEATTMGVFSLIVGFILLILIFKSPFEFVWETYADQDVDVGFMPEKGRGLNPILQNYWINIHPPILFVGYSLMAVPYVFAISGLMNNDFRKWIRLAMPWTLLAAGVLGLGLMLGGLWAYETLGWGGFWAWDPVENSSLIPWLVSVILVHTMYISRKTGGLVKTNFVLAISGFLLVLYATFLTRSGVLGDTSVHSFVSPGPTVYNLLIVFMVLFSLFAIVTLFLKLNKIKSPNLNFDLTSREFMVSLGSIVLMLVTFIVLFGTSWPIITEILGMTKSSVEIEWYDKLNMPLAIVILLMNAFSINLSWNRTRNMNKVFKKVIYGAVTGIVFVIVSVLLGISGISHLLLMFAIGFSFLLNLEFVFKYLKKDLKLVGGYVAHTGVAFLLMGALISGAYTEEDQIRLKNGETAQFMDYSIIHAGKERIEVEKHDREKYKYFIKVVKDGDTSEVNPIIYWSDFNNWESPFFEPGISRYIVNDLYVSPYSLEPHYKVSPVSLRKGEASPISLDSNYRIKMLDFKMMDMQKAASMRDSNVKELKIGALVRLSGPDNYVIEDTIHANMDVASGSNDPIWYTVGTTNMQIGFMQLIPDKENLSNSQALFAFKEEGKPLQQPEELLTFEVSTKPFINLVWIGTIGIVLGFLISMFKYIRPRKFQRSTNEKVVNKRLNKDKPVEAMAREGNA